MIEWERTTSKDGKAVYLTLNFGGDFEKTIRVYRFSGKWYCNLIDEKDSIVICCFDDADEEIVKETALTAVGRYLNEKAKYYNNFYSYFLDLEEGLNG